MTTVMYVPINRSTCERITSSVAGLRIAGRTGLCRIAREGAEGLISLLGRIGRVEIVPGLDAAATGR